ncbi:hypothetical protein [Thiohalorhabdus sp.]|uniref:hypothetical protein n=1 Tax=Thiohalorhabdus sp. TaxID=3094134 RepID=UPI002FC3310E
MRGWLLATALAVVAGSAVGEPNSEPDPRFLAEPPREEVHHHRNRITIDKRALKTGWTHLEQCHSNMDALGATQIVFREERIRAIEVLSTANIEQARVEGPTVQLDGVREGAEICLKAETRNLEQTGDKTFVLRNGPFMRRLFDSYFPLHVSLEVRFPAEALVFRSLEPAPRPGLDLHQETGRISIEAWFSGTLRTRLRFQASGT